MKWNSNKNAQADGGDRTGEKARTVGKIRGGRHTAEIGKSLASIGLALLIGALLSSWQGNPLLKPTVP